LVLALDDLQWADASSISLLFHLGRRIGESYILIVGAYRPNDVALGRARERHPLEPVLNEFKRYCGNVWVDLSRIEEAEGRRFVDTLIETEPNRLSEDFRQALFRHTGGHPLFTIELLRDMQERGDLVRNEQGRWVEGPTLDLQTLPARVERVIEERIGRLEAELREALTVASVEGEDFTAQVVARVQELSERHLVRRLTQELDRRHRLVWEQGIERVGRQRLSLYRFRHNLFQRYLYNNLGQTEREFLHEDVGHVLEALYGDQAEEIAVQLARHFLEAGLDEKALRYLLPAGDRARRGYAHAEAIDLYGRAAEIAGRLGDVEALRRIYEGLGDVYGPAGDSPRAVENYRRALELHTDPRVRADLYNRIGFVNHLNMMDLDRALEAFEQGLQELGGDTETVEAARIHTNLGYLHLFRRRYDLVKKHLERSLALLEGTRHLSDLAMTYANLAFYHNEREDPNPEEAINYASRCIALTERLEDDLPAIPAYVNLGLAHGYRQGQWGQAILDFQEALRMSTRRGLVMSVGYCNCHLAQIYLALDQIEAADHHAQEGVRALEQLGNPWAVRGLCLQIVVRERLGKAEEANALLERARAVRRDRPEVPYYDTACYYGILGDREKALEWLERGRPFFDKRILDLARTDRDLWLLWDDPRFIELMSGPEEG